MSNTKERPNSFKNFFAEPFSYNNSNYGYAVHAKDREEALSKFLTYFDDWDWITDKRYLIAELRSNIKNCWVRWQGMQDEDSGEFFNGWLITDEYHGGQKNWFHVFSTNYDKHYILHGHHFENQIDEDGRQKYRHDCAVCGNVWAR
jgi:hypothetical protein